jgi:tripartite-type tricarboxylate transporter receptor subunit TctC
LAAAGPLQRAVEPEARLWNAQPKAAVEAATSREDIMLLGPLARTWAIAAAVIAASPAAADSVADFYRGKTIGMVMGTGPGGSFDLYGRTIAPHLSRHIPGNPTIVMEHMPGAGGVIAGNYIYATAPQDGTKMLLSHAITLAEKLEPTGVRFETAKMHWLGAYDAIAQMMMVWHTAPAQTIEELKTKDNVVIGSFARSHLTYHWASLLKDAIGAKYKIITGLRSGNENNLAMERGEIHGWTASWENLVGTRPHWLPEKKVKLLVQFTMQRKPYLKDVPTLIEVSPPEKRDVAEFVISGTPISRAIALGPGVPAERVAALRKAFEETMKDPAFLADAEKRKLSIDPTSHQELHGMITKIVSASPELVTRVKKAIGQIE